MGKLLTFTKAGKVRNMTPKIEPKDMPKKHVGRAKKRAQYNRRIIQNIDGNSQRSQGNV